MSEQDVGTPKKDDESKVSPNQAADGKQKLTKNQKIMIGGFAGIITVIGIAAFVIITMLNRPPVAEAPRAGNLTINEDNVAQITKDLQANVAEGMFMTDMNIDWSFPTSKSASTDAYVGNSASNHSPLYFDVTLSDTGEVIYTSDIIPTGYSIKEVKLDTNLSAGTYAATCNYHLLDSETGDIINSIAISITLRILN